MDLRAISLFAGGGGLDLALERVGVRTVCFVEREAFACACLVRQMEEGRLAPAPVWTDVSTFDGRPWRGVVDLVAGGFPCQDIGPAGTRVGIEGERSGLWAQFARIVGEVRPEYVFVENSADLAIRGLDRVAGDLAALGFDAEWGCLEAADAGAPHGRRRLFLLAHPRCVGDERRPRPGDVQPPPAPPAREAPERERGGAGAGPGGAAVAHGHGHGHGLEGEHEAGPTQGPVVGGGRDQVADSDRHGFGEFGIGGLLDGEWTPPRHDAHRRRLPWPPGREDDDGWQEYLRRWPGSEPAIRRGAHGMARRVDRLRLLGNGVVPDQAELAFRVLWKRLHRGRMTAPAPKEGQTP